MNWELTQSKNGFIFSRDGIPVAKTLAVVGAEEKMTALEEGIYRWEVTLPSPVDRMELCLEDMFPTEYAMIPAVSYNGNGWGAGQDYDGFAMDGEPYRIAWHRSSVPGATYTEGKGIGAALFADAEGQCSMSLLEHDDRMTHRLSWPEEEGPKYLTGRDPLWAGPITVPMKPRRVFTANIVLSEPDMPRFGWKKLLDYAWRKNKHDVGNIYDTETIRKLALTYANTLYTEEDDLRAFCIGLHWDEKKGWTKEMSNRYEIGWCGQNASFANSLLTEYIEHGNAEARDTALRVLDSWVSHNRLKGGLFRVKLYPLPAEELEREVQDACNLGTACVQFWEAMDLAEKAGCPRPEYGETARGISDFSVSVQREDGCLGKGWYRDGRLAVAEGTVGAFLIPGLCETYLRTGEEKYLDAAVKAYRYYIRDLTNAGFTTAGALDTYCIDKESSMPLLRSGLSLYEITKDAFYLECAETAAWYLSTWQWHYTTPFPEGSTLKELGYDPFGGTAVSTAHLHIDPYALYYTPELLKLAKYTGHDVWKERARAIWRNGVQCVSDGEMVILGKKRPAGSQDEGFTHTRYWDPFSVSQWLVAWPCAFRLEALRRIPNAHEVFD